MEPTAGHKVLNTTELLEAILLNVNDTKTLLLSQRVSMAFEATITGSIHLQRALTLQPPQVGELIGNNNFIYFREISTPEGYSFRIRYNLPSRSGRIFYFPLESEEESAVHTVTFDFEDKLPTLKVPATGSWRKMWTRVDNTATTLELSGQYNLSYGVWQQSQAATFGDLLDTVVSQKAEMDASRRSARSRLKMQRGSGAMGIGRTADSEEQGSS